MDRKDYDKRMEVFIKELNLLNSPNAATDAIFIDTVLWDYFKSKKIKRMNEACNWLKENYDTGKWYKFPQVFDFRKALDQTHKETSSTYQSTPEQTPEEREEGAKIARQFINEWKKTYPSPKTKEKPNVYKTYRKMREQGKVFEYDRHKWVKREDVQGDYIDPEEKLKDETKL